MSQHARPYQNILLAAIAVAAAGRVLFGGPLDPPTGPIAQTGKPLADVEPRAVISAVNTPGDDTCLFKITQPGSYYLTSNITGVSGKHGILVTADNVTIDLRGFTVRGSAGSLDGIAADKGNGFSVHAGLITGWGGSGVHALSQPAPQDRRRACSVDHVDSSGNLECGLDLGEQARVRDCTANANGNVGIRVDVGGIVTDCAVGSNGATNSGFGIWCGEGTILQHCSATSNLAAGIYTGRTCQISQCSALTNGGIGITCMGASNIADCTCTSNARVGIQTYGPCVIRNCVCTYNTGGIYADAFCEVRDCNCTSNIVHGISVLGDCVVVGNNCVGNGLSVAGAGIFVQGSECRIEDNHLNQNFYGLQIISSVTSCFAVRNSAHANIGINYSGGVGTSVANVVVSPGFTFTSGTPWSNFLY